MSQPRAMGGFEQEVRRLLEDYSAGTLDRIEAWDGRTLEDLAQYLSEEEYQMLLDNLPAEGDEA